MRIALLGETGGPGGAEQMQIHLAEGLRRRGHDVVPFGPSDRSTWLRTQYGARGFDSELFRTHGVVDLGCLRSISVALRRRRVDVLHSHEFTMAIYGAVAARLLGRPHVITMHGGLYYADKMRRRFALAAAARMSDALVAVSTSSAADLERSLWLAAQSVPVIPSGVPRRASDGSENDFRVGLGLTSGDTLVAAIGSVYPVKGHMVLLRAMATLRDSLGRFPCHLVIAGRGGNAEEVSLRRFVEQNEMAKQVHLLGHRDDIGAILAASDIYAMPSLSEGLPLALLEAMAAGVAIVASAVGGIPEAAHDGEHALLVPAGDAAALAASLSTLIRDPTLRARLGRAAARRAADVFGVERMIDGYEALYQRAR
ncbi:MAG: glycosyltransferase family 4 protein [Gemmatimonadaceae bacterium]